MIFETKHRIILLGYKNPEWLKSQLLIEYHGFLEELLNCSFILITDIEVRGTKAYPLCYVSMDVEIFDEVLFRKIKLKYPDLYQKFRSAPNEKPYEIPYNSERYGVHDLVGEYL